jgi:hypothetical protein
MDLPEFRGTDKKYLYPKISKQVLQIYLNKDMNMWILQLIPYEAAVETSPHAFKLKSLLPLVILSLMKMSSSLLPKLANSYCDFNKSFLF